MSLTDDIQAFKADFLKKVPEDIQSLMQSATAKLKEQMLASRSLETGDAAPDFTLPNSQGKPIALAGVRERGPVVISFYRGGWCPYCNLELKALQSRLGDIRRLGGELIAISPEKPEKAQATATTNGLKFEVLTDQGNVVARQYGLEMELDEPLRPVYKEWGADLAEWNGDGSYELPMPATFVIDREGTVIEAFVDEDYTERLDPDAIIAAVERAADDPMVEDEYDDEYP